MSRGLWFVAGAGAGAYVVSRVRRVADSMTVEGLRARWQGLSHGARLLGEDIRTAQARRESELRDTLGLPTPSASGRELAGPPPPPSRPSLVPPMTDRKNDH